ncbi:MAG: hypothetical protein R2745_11160 [Vicinamibacterales bacterium]
MKRLKALLEGVFALAINAWAGTVSAQFLFATMLLSGTAWLIVHRGHWLRRKLGTMWALLVAFVVCGSIGAFGLWAFTSATKPETAAPSATARTEFLLESTKPLKQLVLVVDLKREMTASEIGHFRILLSLVDLSIRVADAKNPGNPHPTLLFGGRDANPRVTSSGVTTEVLGIRTLVYTLNPHQDVQATDFSEFHESTQRIEIRGAVGGQGVLKSIADFDDRSLWMYVTTPFADDIAAIHLVANSYVLFSYGLEQLGRIGVPVNDLWQNVLTESESAVPWTGLQPKGADYDAFMSERARLGHDPDWFPSRMWGSWIPSFETYTPPRLVE